MGLNGALTALRILAGLVISKLVAIHAGPAGMAMVGQLANFTSVLHGLAAAPISAGLVRYSSEHRDGGPAACAPWWRAAFAWMLLISLMLTLPTWFLREWVAEYLFHSADQAWCVDLVLMALPFASLATLATSCNNGLGNYAILMKAGFVGVVVATGLGAALIFAWGLEGALVATGIGMSVSGGWVILFSLRQPWLAIRWWVGRPDVGRMTDIARFMAMALTAAVMVPVIQLLIRNHLILHYGQDTAGLWQATGRISDAYLAVITTSLSLVYVPALARVKSQAQLRGEILGVLKLVVPCAILMSLAVYLLRDPIIAVLYSTRFEAVRDFVAYQSVGDVLKIVSWIWSYALVARGAVKTYIFSEVFFCGLYYLLVLSLTAQTGAIGAVQAYALVYLLYLGFMMIVVPRVLSREFSHDQQ